MKTRQILLLTAEDAEVDAWVEHMQQGLVAAGLDAAADLTPQEAAQAAAMQRGMGAALIRQWKINKSLYEAYGGRIVYQQLGPEPLDAYRTYLEERESAGDFSINDPDLAKGFWRYFRDDSIHDFMETGSSDEAQAFAKPPWEM